MTLGRAAMLVRPGYVIRDELALNAPLSISELHRRYREAIDEAYARIGRKAHPAKYKSFQVSFWMAQKLGLVEFVDEMPPMGAGNRIIDDALRQRLQASGVFANQRRFQLAPGAEFAPQWGNLTAAYKTGQVFSAVVTVAPIPVPVMPPTPAIPITGVWYHGTTRGAAEEILRRGFDLSLAVEGVFGRGVYFTPTEVEAYAFGPAVVSAEIQGPLFRVSLTNEASLRNLFRTAGYTPLAITEISPLNLDEIISSLADKGYAAVEVLADTRELPPAFAREHPGFMDDLETATLRLSRQLVVFDPSNIAVIAGPILPPGVGRWRVRFAGFCAKLPDFEAEPTLEKLDAIAGENSRLFDRLLDVIDRTRNVEEREAYERIAKSLEGAAIGLDKVRDALEIRDLYGVRAALVAVKSSCGITD